MGRRSFLALLHAVITCVLTRLHTRAGRSDLSRGCGVHHDLTPVTEVGVTLHLLP